jgi:hypothetical protein
MNKIEVNSPALTVFPASFSTLQPARRLIVLVPESEADTALTARKIWELANTLECGIQFLGLSKDAEHEPGVRRQLVTLSAMVGYDNISVESKIEIGNDWLSVVKSNWHEGDVIVCFTGQNSGLARRPLNQILESNLKATVYVLTDLEENNARVRPSWVSTAIAWSGSIGIILGFFWLQSRLVHPPADWMHTALLYVSIFAEAGLVWIWNSLF